MVSCSQSSIRIINLEMYLKTTTRDQNQVVSTPKYSESFSNLSNRLMRVRESQSTLMVAITSNHKEVLRCNGDMQQQRESLLIKDMITRKKWRSSSRRRETNF